RDSRSGGCTYCSTTGQPATHRRRSPLDLRMRRQRPVANQPARRHRRRRTPRTATHPRSHAMTEDTEYSEQWVGSTARPLEHRSPRARVTKRDGRNWITCPDELNGKKVIIEMPDNAPTKS